MRGFCRVFVLGTLGSDPELRKSAQGEARWTDLSLAVNRRRKGDGDWVEITDWHRVRVWGDQAERCHRMLRKGAQVGIEGALVVERWTDTAGQRHTSNRIHADRVEFVSYGRREDAPSAGASAVGSPEAETVPLPF